MNEHVQAARVTKMQTEENSAGFQLKGFFSVLPMCTPTVIVLAADSIPWLHI